MKAHPVFHIGLLKDFISSSPESEVSDNIPSTNDLLYGDDTSLVHSIIDHRIAPHPLTYAKGPELLFRVKWEGYDSSEDSWKLYVNVKRTDCLTRWAFLLYVFFYNMPLTCPFECYVWLAFLPK
jgi:hypothetical protein